jgi:dynein heavy chain
LLCSLNIFRLTEVEEGIATLQAKYNDCVNKKEELERKVQECEDRLVRADKLIGGLADEKDRWAESVTTLDQQITSITGSVLVAAGYVAYLGPFNVSVTTVEPPYLHREKRTGFELK